jgi:SAM-dependent methyltransferase
MQPRLGLENADRFQERLHAAEIPDFIGEFAIGVGNVRKQHVVVDIHGHGDGIVRKLNQTGAKVICINQAERMDGTMSAAPWQAHRTGAGLQVPRFKIALESGSADILFADLVLHHLQVPSQAITEMKRILKSGGRLVITEIGKCEDAAIKTAGRDRWTGFYPGDLRHWLKTAGFSNIIVNPVPAGPLCSSPCLQGFIAGSGYLMATGTA